MSVASLTPAPAAPTFSVREARKLLHDQFVHRPMIYWADLLITVGIGYTFAMLYFEAPAFSLPQLAFMLIGGFALFRAGSFIHEITHMRHGEMLAFRTTWNILCGIPMLMPSFFYENHIDHHKSHRYGTKHDGEYLPLGAGPVSRIFWFYAQVPLLPAYVFLRFMFSPVSFLHPKLRQWTLEHASSFVINFRHRLTIPKSAPRKVWAWLELACCARAAMILGVVYLGVFPPTRLAAFYCLAMFVLGLNYVRNLVAHHYRNTGDSMSHLEQLEDSVNITGHWFWTELFFPLGLRYHALHHLFPSLPYHNLGKAHRRLMAELPSDSPYRGTVYPGFWAVVRQLLSDARASQRSTKLSRAMAK